MGSKSIKEKNEIKALKKSKYISSSFPDIEQTTTLCIKIIDGTKFLIISTQILSQWSILEEELYHMARFE